MEVANIDLCKELYELSAWLGDTEYNYNGVTLSSGKLDSIPAYTLGYLLRKLPNYVEYWDGGNESGYLELAHFSKYWSCGYSDDNEKKSLAVHLCDTPEDAVCKLAIELFKQGVLKNDKD